MRRALHRMNTNLLTDFDPRWIVSADTPEGFEAARRVVRP